MTYEYHLQIANKHMLAHLPAGPALVDTGSPVSMSRGSIALPWHPTLPGNEEMLANISREVGLPLHYLIGMDALASERVLLDLIKGHMVIGTSEDIVGRQIAMSYSLGTPSIQIRTGILSAEALLDTGAQLSYAPRAVVGARTAVGSTTDFYLGIGRFQTSIFRIELEIEGEPVSLDCGQLPEIGCLAGFDRWIIGVDFFRDRAVLLDFPSGQCKFTTQPIRIDDEAG